MKRYFSLILALLMGVFGFGFSDKSVESRAALLSAQPVIAEFTAAAAPTPVNEIKTIVATEIEPAAINMLGQTLAPTTEFTTEFVTEAETESVTEVKAEETTEKSVETTAKVEETKKQKKNNSYLWPADINAEIIAGYPSYSSGGAHWGVDIGLYDDNGCNISRGTDILAARDGVVVTAYNDGNWNTGFGNYCIIDHGNGVQTLYAHSSDIQVCEGDTVEQGQVIGIVGDTGNTTAPHLHFEVRVENGNGGYKRVNPMKFISEP